MIQADIQQIHGGCVCNKIEGGWVGWDTKLVEKR